MDDMLTFITKHMKRKGNMVMQDLMDVCKMSRAKFYKCLKEPIRFSDEELRAVSKALDLDENENNALFAYKQFPEPETVQKRFLANTLIERTIFGRSDVVTDQAAMIFRVFEEDRTESFANVLSADGLAAKFNQRIAGEAPEGTRFPLEILIFNAHLDEKLHVLYALLRSLSVQPKVVAAHEIFMRHFIMEDKTAEQKKDSSAGRKVRHYANLTPLAAYGNYSLAFSDQLQNVFFGTTDSVFIRYQGADQQERYLVMNILGKSDVSVYSFKDSNLNAFFTYNFTDLLAGSQKRNWLPCDTITVNAYLTELVEQYPQILVTPEPCFDCMIPEIWDFAESNVRQNMNVPSRDDPDITLMEALRKNTDPLGQSAICTDAQFVSTLFAQFRKRFEISEKKRAINLITPYGLKRFSETGIVSEMEFAELALPPELIIQQLEYIRADLGKLGSANKQAFYLVNPVKKSLDKSMIIFENKLIAYLFNQDGIPVTNWQTISDQDVTNLFYSYIVEELLPERKRTSPDSVIMSDEWACEFLDGLISGVRSHVNRSN